MGDSPIEAQSPDCGYVPPIEYDYRWIITDKTVCIGYDKYKLYKKQRRRQVSGATWEDVIPTVYSYNGEGTEDPVLVQEHSTDCGYVPGTDPIYKWEIMDIATDWICSDCDDIADFKLRYWNANSSGETYCDVSSAVTRSDYNNDTTIQRIMVSTCVTAITDGAFSGCTRLATIQMPDTVKTIGERAFYACNGIIDFTLPQTITTIGDEAFRGCIQMNSMILPNDLISLGAGAFRGCKNFPSINIPSKLATIPQYCFYDCDGMTDLILPDSVISIGSYAFAECSGLVNVVLTNPTPPELATTAFQNVNSDFTIYVPNAYVNTYKTASVWSNYANNIQGF